MVVIDLLKVSAALDRKGFYKESDSLMESALRVAQYGGYNFETPIETRMVRFRDINEEFEALDADRMKHPRFRRPDRGGPKNMEKEDEASIFEMNGGDQPDASVVVQDNQSAGMTDTSKIEENFGWDAKYDPNKPYYTRILPQR